jgi:hypothetical protein
VFFFDLIARLFPFQIAGDNPAQSVVTFCAARSSWEQNFPFLDSIIKKIIRIILFWGSVLILLPFVLILN